MQLTPAENDWLEYKDVAPEQQKTSWFSFPSLNLSDFGANLVQSIESGYSKVKANVSRLISSSSAPQVAEQSGSTAQQIRNWLVGIPAAPNLVSMTKTASTSVSDFFNSTMWKILLVVVIGAVVALFFISYVQAKAGRLANA